MTQSTSEFLRTEEIVSNAALRKIVGQRVRPEDTHIQVCAGEWRRQNETYWVFYMDPDFVEDAK